MDIKITKEERFTKQVTARVAEPVYKLLKERARKEGVTVGKVIRSILEMYIYE